MGNSALAVRGNAMRHVVTNHMVAHLWAQQHPELTWARNSADSYSFNGVRLVSYNTTVARFTDATLPKEDDPEQWERVVLFLDWNRGVTTSRHIHMGLRALRPGFMWFRVDSVGTSYSEPDHQRNAAALFDKYREHVARIIKPHVYLYGYGESVADRERAIYDASRTYRRYCQAFNVPEPNPNFEAHIAHLHANFRRYYDPKAADQRNKASARAHLRNADMIGRCYAFLEGVLPKPPHDWQNKRVPYEVRSRIRGILHPYRSAEHGAITPEQWINGAGNANGYQLDWPNYTLLRRKGDKLETSQGANVPWSDALRAFIAAQGIRLGRYSEIPRDSNGGLSYPQGEGPRVGYFRIDRIDPDGTMYAGCHTLRWSEMQRLAIREVPHLVKPRYPLPALREPTLAQQWAKHDAAQWREVEADRMRAKAR